VRHAVVIALLVGCGSDGSSGAIPTDAKIMKDGARPDGTITPPADGGGDANLIDADTSGDGTPTRQACTSNFGSGLTQVFGRLDGYLVAIVQPGSMNTCNDDDAHVHLQIRMNGSIYDIAIDATDGSTGVDDVHTATLDIPLPGGSAWSEGWHPNQSVDYPTLGMHSTSMPLDSKAQVVSTLESDLATVNHISVYATGYGPDGAHLVHRNGGNQDGLVVTEPTSAQPHARLFAFSDQTF
jgi:hypothetical protein